MRIPIRCICLCLLLGLLCGCGGGTQAAADEPEPAGEARASEPVLYVPQAPGSSVLGQAPLVVDVSNASQGYVMAKYSGSAQKAVVQLTGSDGITYKYFLPSAEDFVPLPLTSGSGTYAVDGYENVSGTTYATLFKQSVDVTLDSEFLPYLYPNQYVLFDESTEAVQVAAETVSDASGDLDAVEKIYHYVIDHVTYDDEKAATVTGGYLPTVDDTLHTGTGICFDYAALTTAMLRSQNIPTRLEIGYSGSIYHSWISVYVEDQGWIDKLIEFTGSEWTRMDPTFASNGKSSKSILKYIGDGTNYSLQYLH